jgi:hypothetical protein
MRVFQTREHSFRIITTLIKTTLASGTIHSAEAHENVML